MSTIKDIKARKIFDSRGNPTLEVDVILDNGIVGQESVPSGASTGATEVYKLENIAQAIVNIEKIKPNIIGQDPSAQEKLDVLMINLDGTKQKKNIGGNAILALSLAICEAASKDKKIPLYKYIRELSAISSEKIVFPRPMFNIINGGKHSDSNLPFQEFMVVPMMQESYAKNLEAGVKIYHQLKKDLHEMNLSTNVGDEGGFAPAINSNEEAMEIIVDSINHSGFKPMDDIALALDVAADSIADLNAATYPLAPVAYFEKIVTEYPIVSIEDPLPANDWSSWQEITKALGEKMMIVGYDIFTTNPDIYSKGIANKIANAVLVKPDQIGTLTETLRTIRMAKEAHYKTVISHRSGETESTFIAHLAVGVGSEYIKTGAPARGERIAKYNELLRIEEDINKNM